MMMTVAKCNNESDNAAEMGMKLSLSLERKNMRKFNGRKLMGLKRERERERERERGKAKQWAKKMIY